MIGTNPDYNEAKTRAKLIDPAIRTVGWTEDLIKREETAGEIQIVDGKARRLRGRTDYTLRVKVSQSAQPVALALIEAKKARQTPDYGLEQAKVYARCQQFNVKFVFSTNGHQFVEYDFFTGKTTAPRPLSEFPTPEELRQRYETGMGFGLEDEAAKPLLQPYRGGEAQRRYYQDAAIRAVLEKVAQCEREGKAKRALLSLATGAGKTFIAVNLLKKAADAGQLKRALFLCDRDELRTQGLKATQDAFGSDAAEVFRDANGENNARNARVHVATYQTLGVDGDNGDPSFLTKNYPPGYFSHIIIDECHRSAWGKWSQVLLRNPDAVQVGLTATPRKLRFEYTKESELDHRITTDNEKYFGEPAYVYDMAQAIEDGYLAACVIQRGRVNLDDTGITLDDIMARNPRDPATGKTLTADEVRERYEANAYEDKVMLPDRVIAMCQDFFNYLCETGGPEQKSIVFCVRDSHADAVAAQWNNLYSDWCKENGKERAEPFAFKCTAASSGNDQLPDLRGAKNSHFIACTVDLLTTGVDVPCVRNIGFFRYVNSPISFYQMVGRGTRLDPDTGKMMFTVYDYTDATRLFGEEFITAPLQQPTVTGTGPAPPPPEQRLIVDGFDVEVRPDGRFVVMQVDGKAMPVPVEEYEQGLAEKLVEQAPTLEAFRSQWVAPPLRRELLDALVLAGFSASVLRMVKDLNDCDLYDVLADSAYGMAARTREERSWAFRFKSEEWLKQKPEMARKALLALVDQFKDGGTDALESPQVFRTPSVVKAGGLAALQTVGNPGEVLRETKERMFEA